MRTHRRSTPDISMPGASRLWQARLRGSGLVIAALLGALAFVPPLGAADWICASGDVACLIEAIHQANGNGEANTLTLEAGTYTFTMADLTTAGATGLPSVTGTLTITGADAETTVLDRAVAAPPFRLVHVAVTGHLTLEGLTLRGGRAVDGGGGLLIEGTVQLRNSAVVDNAADDRGGGPANKGGMAALWGTLLARNTAQERGPNCSGPVTSLGHNRFGDLTDCLLSPQSTDRTGEPDVDSSPDLGILGQGDPLRQRSGPAIAPAAVPRFAYGASKASNRVYGYTIDATTGALMANGSVPACRGPVALTATRTGRWLYVVCGDSFEVWVFTVGATGQLGFLQTMPVYGDPEAVAIAPSDRCLYVTKNLAGAGPLTTSFTLQRYTINAPTGELAFAEEQRTQGANPDAVAVTPQGDYVFVANFSGGASSTYAGGNVMTFRANPSTGAMTPVGLVQTGVAPVSLEVDPSGTWLFVAHSSRDGVAMYAIDHLTGHLTLADRRGSYAAALAVHPDDKSLYVTYWDDKTLGAYTIDHAAGKLVLRQTVRDTGGAPSTYQGAAVVNPVGPLYVVNIYNSTGYQAGNVQVYPIDRTTGNVTAGGTMAAGSQPAALALVY